MTYSVTFLSEFMLSLALLRKRMSCSHIHVLLRGEDGACLGTRPTVISSGLCYHHLTRNYLKFHLWHSP